MHSHISFMCEVAVVKYTVLSLKLWLRPNKKISVFGVMGQGRHTFFLKLKFLSNRLTKPGITSVTPGIQGEWFMRVFFLIGIIDIHLVYEKWFGS